MSMNTLEIRIRDQKNCKKPYIYVTLVYLGTFLISKYPKYKIQKYMYMCTLKHQEKKHNTLHYTQYNIFHVEKQYIQNIQDFPRYTYNFFPHTLDVLPQDSTRFPVEGVWKKYFFPHQQKKIKKVLMVERSNTHIRVLK